MTFDDLRQAYAGKRVLLTGHTGFKGGWLALWLESLGARVTGFALPPPTSPSFFEDCGVAQLCEHVLGDLRDPAAVREVVRRSRPEVVFHLAAQPLVRLSYESPVETFETNVMGTAHLLEALRLEQRPAAVVVVTSDKCYENREWAYGYREEDALGGHDPYSASKGAAEIVAASYRRSFFAPARLAEHGVALATARAGNVIGGGDWAADRIVPDAARALAAGVPIPVRNPASVRPWQHVLEPLGGYLLLGARLLGAPDEAARCCGPWNFGPAPESARPVRDVVEAAVRAWGSGSWQATPQVGAPHEAGLLRLAIEKAVSQLAWRPRWELEEAVGRTFAWYRARHEGAGPAAMRDLSLRQIGEYLSA
ncbi:CDP-glucose 4,6-dehydratase [Anaeromyxobacter paludicola]|uniref:CDP-glucose 4,6-dehydratase n=1 Tax=Anaeromyxobacter paludicola TaxID=2918171 RepID=A0ABN6N2J8_9BACT|nr:CDP-glucose 4,6-dehydratase [Anaeromyxobacter paludicola]BDG07171.1 CDP-glucose 4,6-dehydratase [Anaeromyxobacter paludicola]